ncbi:ATP-binding protein [Rhodococcus tukisamuensis]|uniref:Serine/threonine-protein kinase RsbW n=1 Tax=Rhodococcus tukisamuensis TaxID=168276 RepID=A0A1G6W0Q9_9NOCA|nr:ATP-binding protein [Rhodococcus tukisamuensis]SDD58807.1 serine/threonine-protein kinase RsbW [Rhodococcus tukisamuensis]
MANDDGQGIAVMYSGAPVELCVIADFAQLPVLRAMAETIAVLGEFNLDEVSDIKLAADEVCTDLIKDAQPGAQLTCRYELTGGVLRVRVSTTTRGERMPSEESFGWHVLRVLTDSISVTHTPLGKAGYRSTVEFDKLRGGDI